MCHTWSHMSHMFTLVTPSQWCSQYLAPYTHSLMIDGGEGGEGGGGKR